MEHLEWRSASRGLMWSKVGMYILGFRVTVVRCFGQTVPSFKLVKMDEFKDLESSLCSSDAKVSMGTSHDIPEFEILIKRCVTIAGYILVVISLVACRRSSEVGPVTKIYEEGLITCMPRSRLLLTVKSSTLTVCHSPTSGNRFPGCRFKERSAFGGSSLLPQTSD